VYILFYTDSVHQWCWEKLQEKFGNVIGVVMSGYLEIVKNPYVVLRVNRHIGIRTPRKKDRI